MAYEDPTATWEQYTNAVVDIFVGDKKVTLSRRGVETPTSVEPNAGECVYIVTACNPRRQLTKEENDARHAELVQAVTDLQVDVWDAVGWDRRRKHGEPSLAIRGLTRDEARQLGAQYGQDAIFEWTRYTWAVIPCGPGSGSVFRDGRLIEQPWFPDLRLLRRLRDHGLDERQAALFESFGVTPELVSGDLLDALPFLQAAEWHGLDSEDVQSFLRAGKGDPDQAWELWSEESND